MELKTYISFLSYGPTKDNVDEKLTVCKDFWNTKLNEVKY